MVVTLKRSQNPLIFYIVIFIIFATYTDKCVSFQENQLIIHRNSNLNEYYESLRNNVITLLEHVKIPGGGTVPVSTAPGTPGAAPPTGPGDKPAHDNFDSYLTKLQTLCSPEGYCPDENRPIYETVKNALQDFTVLPTPI